MVYNLIILIFLVSFTAISCDEYNLYESNKSFASIPVSDQDSTGSCFAYTATTLIYTQRFENGVNQSKRTHPLFAAYAFVDRYTFFKKDLESGLTNFAIRAVANSKLCYEDEGTKLIKEYKGENKLSDAEFMNVLSQTYEYFSKKERKE